MVQSTYIPESAARLIELCGSYKAGDGFFEIMYGEWAGHVVRGFKPKSAPKTGRCVINDHPVEDDGNTDGGKADKLPWSAHFHLGYLSEGPTDYPNTWDHKKCFCARGATPEEAIRNACRQFGVELA